MKLHQLNRRTACPFCGAPGFCQHGDPHAPGAGRIPGDPRVLRVVAALADLWVIDHSGGARLWTYDAGEIAEALHFLAHANRGEVFSACTRARWVNGDAPDPRVVAFPSRAEVAE